MHFSFNTNSSKCHKRFYVEVGYMSSINNLLLYHPACIYFFSPSFMLIISGSVEGSLSEGIKSFMYSTLIEREVLTFLSLLPSSC